MTIERLPSQASQPVTNQNLCAASQASQVVTPLWGVGDACDDSDVRLPDGSFSLVPMPGIVRNHDTGAGLHFSLSEKNPGRGV